MSLYDDIDESPKAKAVPAGWSSGIKLLQSQLQLKKAMVTQPKREAVRKVIPAASISSETVQAAATESTVVVRASRETKVFINPTPVLPTIIPKIEKSLISELDWDLSLEYDPMHPSDYDKITKERKERRGMEIEIEEAEKKRKTRDERDTKGKDRPGSLSGFAGRAGSDEEEEEPPVKKAPAMGGVAIAPPPSLQQDSQAASGGSASGTLGGLGVAAKIMAKYGFKEGQGLGRQQQGISTALQVEKTSKRGGRIINEDVLMPPPPPVPVAAPVPKPELTIAEMMKNPSKVILLRNMVGPGEVDSDLEPEVREECHTKYGEVQKVIIFELPDVEETEAVRIFVEFKRIEAAIKAVIDLNGRFFAGRQVKGAFYDVEKFLNLELSD